MGGRRYRLFTQQLDADHCGFARRLVGAILSYIMCRAMNRSFFSVILGGFGAAEGAVASGGQQKAVKSGSAEDVAFLLGNADSVIIVPGYGLAVGRAQHATKRWPTS
jgi:NAD(P) transhydrogenase subunit beta